MIKTKRPDGDIMCFCQQDPNVEGLRSDRLLMSLLNGVNTGIRIAHFQGLELQSLSGLSGLLLPS